MGRFGFLWIFDFWWFVDLGGWGVACMGLVVYEFG